MDLREKIAEVLYEAPASDGALAKIACDVALRRAQRRADAVMGVVEDHTRALEDENQRMRDDLASRIVEEERSVQRKILKDPTNPSLAGLLAGLQRSRDIVTSRAREIAEEEA